ncbi:chromatin-remodeling ATPase INO80-like [Humulus lupulus]|uniref:chromatin-remodeling ATPase INO80-like n=1 Tax=Humulus lupulus TaxID=3486 RepID=UPI002B4076F5|nr:chromatin-remodeling ATPase INO80-like [Humulus lupulus]XP_062106561.1 chromatin-remodeling ATPase INO80-like [Humulus lupulus]XP_062106562.1 chromatin-remodeling ATPase INO80-like [Humulus lupulus]
MAEESIGFQMTPTTGKKEKIVPHYLRASTGSCHDFCKFGKKHEAEELARYPIPKRLAAKLSGSRSLIETADSPAIRKSSKVKLKNSPGSRIRSPRDSNICNRQALTRSLDSLNVVKTDEEKKPLSVKHEAAVSSKSRTHDIPKTMKQKLSASTEKLEISSKKASTEAKRKSFSGKHQTSPKSNSAPVKPLSSPESSGRLNRNGETRIGKSTGTSVTVAPKKGLASPKVSLPTKTSQSSVASLNRKQQGNRSLKKNVSPIESNNKVRIAEPTESINVEVPEKTLYVIKMETENNALESDQNETCAAEVEPLPYILSLSPNSSPLPDRLSSSPLPGCLSSPSPSPHEEEEEVKQKQEEEEDNEEREEDQQESEYTISESEDYTFSENSETESLENSETLDTNNKIRRSSGLVCDEEGDDKGSKLKFRRGKVVDMHTEDNAPRKLKFRRGRVLDNQNVTADARRRRFKKREEVDDANAEAGSEKVVLKHQDVQGKKDAQGLFNNVIEETASKLVETRKSKVKALVGAFETVISLQDKKPSSNSQLSWNKPSFN